MNDLPHSHHERVIMRVISDVPAILDNNQVPVAIPPKASIHDHTAVRCQNWRAEVHGEVKAGVIPTEALGQYTVDREATRCAAFSVRNVSCCWRGHWYFRRGNSCRRWGTWYVGNGKLPG